MLNKLVKYSYVLPLLMFLIVCYLVLDRVLD